jgi:uncharacterized repeat protein (TIGR03803 family)
MRKLAVLALALASLASCKKDNTTTTTSPITTPTVTPTGGTYTTMHIFNDTLGAFPANDLIMYNSLLYGTTPGDGVNIFGNIFSITTAGAYVDMYEFASNGINGSDPVGDLTAYNNVLYGMTHQGGTGGGGVIYSINPTTKALTVLSNFGSGNNNGFYPEAGLIVSGTGIMYGTTTSGGMFGNGNIFSFNPSGNVYTDLYDFDQALGGGIVPNASLVLSASGTVLYGTASLGGPDNEGVVFSVNTNGTGFTTLVNFGGARGQNPDGSLLLVGSTLYGMSNAGGNNVDSVGTIYSVNTDGTGFATLLDFNGTNGANPYGALIANSGTLYGLATGGGTIGGVLFSIGTNGSGYTNLVNFGVNNVIGASPHGSLLLSNNVLYGMTLSGGKGYGTVFSYKL